MTVQTQSCNHANNPVQRPHSGSEKLYNASAKATVGASM